MISRYAKGAQVQGIYNATNSPPIDIIECLLGHLRIHTPPVLLLRKEWEHFIATHEPDAKFFQVCHSGGAIHVVNALNSSSKSVQNKIIVLAIAPGAIVPEYLCFRSYNYASKRDFVPKLDIIGNLRYGDELILLEPHPDAKKHDHNFDSPTFQEVIQNRIINYLKEYGDQQ